MSTETTGSLLRPDEQLTLGVNVIIRPGDEPWKPRYERFVAPQEWMALTGPCPTCGGENYCTPQSGFDTVVDCQDPDCRDGRRIVPLYRQDPAYYSPPNFNQILVGRGSIEVVPVVEDDSGPTPKSVVIVNGAEACLILDAVVAAYLPLDPLPVPGRDFGIVIDCVELA